MGTGGLRDANLVVSKIVLMKAFQYLFVGG